MLPVDAAGRLDLARLSPAPSTRTWRAEVSVMWANNEVGTVQAIPGDRSDCREQRRDLPQRRGQAIGHVQVDFAAKWARSADLHRAQARRTVQHQCAGRAAVARLAPLLRRRSGRGRVRSAHSGRSGCRGPCRGGSPRDIGSGAAGGTAWQLDQLGARRRASARLHGPTPNRSPSGYRQHPVPRVLGRRDFDAAGLRGNRLFDWCGLLGQLHRRRATCCCHGIHRERGARSAVRFSATPRPRQTYWLTYGSTTCSRRASQAAAAFAESLGRACSP